MQTRQHLGLVLLLVPFAAGCQKGANLSAAAKPANGQPIEARLQQLLSERVATTQLAREAIDAAFAANGGNFDDLRLVADAQWKAELAVADEPGERVAIHKRHVEDLRRCELFVQAQYNVAARGGEAEKFALAKFNRQCAQIALVEACIATGQPYPTFDGDLEPPADAADVRSPDATR